MSTILFQHCSTAAKRKPQNGRRLVAWSLVGHFSAPAFLAFVSLSLVFGCPQNGRGLWPWTSNSPQPPPPAKIPGAEGFTWIPPESDPSDRAVSLEILQMSFDVLRVDMPVSTVRHSAKVWNHVDELRAGPAPAAQLARNGIRCGVSNSESWPAISAILKACNARSAQNQITTQPGVPLTVILGTFDEPESVFHYSRANALTGKTMPAGDRVISVDYAYRPEFGGITELRLAFEVRYDRGTIVWEKEEGMLRPVPGMDRHMFGDLEVLLELKPSEFVVVAPGDRADLTYLVGGRFFLGREDSAQRIETLLFITPRVYRPSRDAPRKG